MVRRMSDPDGMGATPTHQAEVHKINTAIWGPKDGSAGEIPLPVPFQDLLRVDSHVTGRRQSASRRQVQKNGSKVRTALQRE